jgi:hypothetical protein
MPDHRRSQRDLFDEVDTSHLPPLDTAHQQTVTQLLSLWLQALAKTIEAEVSDEQDQR